MVSGVRPGSAVSRQPQRITMSGHGFHVHGPHDHEVEHAAHAAHEAPAGGAPGGHHGPGITSQVAMFTAIVATVGAIFGYMSGATQANAGLYKNNAAIKKTEASNQWNFYQAKSSKQNLSELALDLSSGEELKAKYRDKIARYEKEKNEIKLEAERLEKESAHFDEMSEQQLHLHHH
mgnify:CR=1 FL=1